MLYQNFIDMFSFRCFFRSLWKTYFRICIENLLIFIKSKYHFEPQGCLLFWHRSKWHFLCRKNFVKHGPDPAQADHPLQWSKFSGLSLPTEMLKAFSLNQKIWMEKVRFWLRLKSIRFKNSEKAKKSLESFERMILSCEGCSISVRDYATPLISANQTSPAQVTAGDKKRFDGKRRGTDKIISSRFNNSVAQFACRTFMSKLKNKRLFFESFSLYTPKTHTGWWFFRNFRLKTEI